MTGPNINVYQELRQALPENRRRDGIDYHPVGRVSNERIAKAMIQAACTGRWLLIDNLHLQMDILPNIIKLFDVMVMRHKAQKQKIHESVVSFYKKLFIDRRLDEERNKFKQKHASESSQTSLYSQ
jgi:PhoPQ-activated pathogenicity-related protein